MKSTPIIFITFNSINKYLSHASLMHIHTQMKSSRFGAVFRHTRVTQMFMDSCGPQHVYAPYGHFSLIIPYLFVHYFFTKRLYHPLHHQQSHDRLSPSSQHHVLLHPPYILLFIPYSPVICKDFFPFIYIDRKSVGRERV